MVSNQIHWNIEEHDRVGSTQVLAKQSAAEGVDHGTVIQALEQVKGYGRHGRHWVSDKGNLSLSIVLRPNQPLQEIYQLSFVVSLSLFDTLVSYVDKALITLKWPNDVLIDGKKCAGILLEADTDQSNAVSWVVVGTGVNIANKPFDEACALSEFIKPVPYMNDFRDQFLNAFNERYDQWITEGFDSVRKNWLECGMDIGTDITVKHGQHHKSGLYKGLDAQGNLVLEGQDGSQSLISAGDVHFSELDKKGAA